MTSGRGTFTMQFEKYSPVSQSIAEQIFESCIGRLSQVAKVYVF